MRGISFVDSSSLEVCKRYRISMHKVFAGIAARSKTTKGWFYGLKLHLLINQRSGIIKASFSSGNKDDREQLKLMIKGSRFSAIDARAVQRAFRTRNFYGHESEKKYEK